MNRTRAVALASLGLFLLLPGRAAAQHETFEFAPYVGAYVPTGVLTHATITPVGDPTFEVDIEQDAALMFGGRLVAWWSRVLGWEGAFSYALSDVRVTDPDGTDACATFSELSCTADVWGATSKLLARWAPSESGHWYLFGGLGLAVVGHGGDFWTIGDATTDLGGVVGAGAVLDLSPRFALRLDIEDWIYSFDPKVKDDEEIDSVDLDSQGQNDLAISLGLVISLWGGA